MKEQEARRHFGGNAGETLVSTVDQAAAMPAKPWDQCGLEEKVERIRMELLSGRHRLDALFHMMQNHERQIDLLDDHTHDMRGEVVIPRRKVNARRDIYPATMQPQKGFDPLA